jgi:hypothetical protein
VNHDPLSGAVVDVKSDIHPAGDEKRVALSWVDHALSIHRAAVRLDAAAALTSGHGPLIPFPLPLEFPQL